MKTLFERLCDPAHLRNAWEIVHKKKSSGGIDKITLEGYDSRLNDNLAKLCQSLKSKTWKPQPYMSIKIPKKDSSMRELGLLSIEDKIVQQAIKLLIEPILEKQFYNSNYAYRPGRGHLKAVRRTIHECRQAKNHWYLRLDIDNFFDSIDHSILFSRLKNAINDSEICRLIELCLLMGSINKSQQWSEKAIGIPQGAILSPILANLYMTSFDQFINSFTKTYVRYADDFIIWCENEQAANTYLERISKHLDTKLKLKLNKPHIGTVIEGFDFLGLTFNNDTIAISENKRQELIRKILDIEVIDGKLSKRYSESLSGIEKYYLSVLPVPYQNEFREILFKAIFKWAKSQEKMSYKSFRTIFSGMPLIEQLDKDYKKALKEIYQTSHNSDQLRPNQKKNLNKKLIQSRKLEYQRRENDNSELIITSYGYFIGVNNRGITLRKKRRANTNTSIISIKTHHNLVRRHNHFQQCHRLLHEQGYSD